MPGGFRENQNIGIKQYLDMLCYGRHLLWRGYKTDAQWIRVSWKPVMTSSLKKDRFWVWSSCRISNGEIHFLNLGLGAEAVCGRGESGAVYVCVDVSGVRWWCWWGKRGINSLSVMMEGWFPFTVMFCITLFQNWKFYWGEIKEKPFFPPSFPLISSPNF